jgi:putative transposase
MGQPDALITPHDCWLLLGESDEERVAACRGLFNEKLNQSDIDSIRQSVDTGLPTGNDRFRREIEQALSIKPGYGKRGRPSKAQD